MKELYEYKLDLLYYGISLSPNCYQMLKKGSNGQVNNDDYITTKGLMVLLDNKIYVNANLYEASKYQIDFENDEFCLLCEGLKVCSVKIIQPPDYALDKVALSTGKLITDVVNVHGDRLRLQPISGCANHCKFCDINKYGYQECSIEELDEAFTYAMKNVSFRHVLISGGTPRSLEESYEYLNRVYKYFGEKYGDNYPIDIMLVPRGLTVRDDNSDGYRSFIKSLKNWKISGLYVNLELYNSNARKNLIPQKSLVGYDNYLKFIKLAVEVFGIGNVKSCLVVGLESIPDTLKAVKDLCEIGCVPILSPYVPIDDSIDAPTPDFMKEVLIKTREITEKYNIDLGPSCQSCRHNTIHFK